jgi:hypothetical protein
VITLLWLQTFRVRRGKIHETRCYTRNFTGGFDRGSGKLSDTLQNFKTFKRYETSRVEGKIGNFSPPEFRGFESNPTKQTCRGFFLGSVMYLAGMIFFFGLHARGM